MRSRRRHLRTLVVLLGAGGLLGASVIGTGCRGSGTGSGAGGCSTPHRDPFDPRSVVHILPGGIPPPYLTNPPTSGEHQPVNVLTYRGAWAQPIAPQVQVALLESSEILVQYRPPVTADQLGALTSTPLVTLAPNPMLPAPIVASAWLWRLRCTGPAPAALPALRLFIAAHAGKGPQPPPSPS